MIKKLGYKMVNFISIVPKWIGGVSLSLVVLKNYLLFKNPSLNITLNKFFCDDDPEYIVNSILSTNCEVIGFSVYMWNINATLKICSLLKKRKPDCFIILGGPTATFDANNLMLKYKSIDMIVKGEGEKKILQVLSKINAGDNDFSTIPNLIYRKDDKLLESFQQISVLNIEDQHYLIDVKDFDDVETVYYETSRGCVFKCNYCAWNVNQSGVRKIRYYPLEKILMEINALFDLPKLKMLLFTDSNILLGGKRTLQIFNKVNLLNQERRKKGLPLVKINFEFNPEHLTDELLTEVKKLFVENYPIGLQSVNANVLKEANRPFNKEKYLENINKLREKSGASILVEIIYGLPNDTYEGFRQTLEFVLSEINAELFVCYKYSVLPGSFFWQNKSKYNLKHEKNSPYLIISTSTFSEEELNNVEMLVYYLQIIFRIFRSIKKDIDKNIHQSKLSVYEEIINMFYNKYGDLFKPKLVYDNGFLEDVNQLRSREFADTRHKMLSDARQIIKKYKKNGEEK